MKFKFRFKLFVTVIIFFLCLTLCACSKTVIEEYEEEGYVITVRYESNGGTYLDREGITLIDMFNPADYSTDSSGEIHIKLVEPTDSSRPSGGAEGIYITRTDYFLVGWYTNRELRKVNDKVVDEDGNYLTLVNDTYVLESDNETEATPAYDYSGYWDFANDTLDYKVGSGEYDLTLYAVWSEYFRFDYYYLNNGNWEKYGSTSFDYATTNKTGSTTYDKDTIYMPSWVDGAMSYEHLYANKSKYSFPNKSGYTFNSAYLDSECTQEILDSYEHQGTIDFETGKAINNVCNIYVKFDEGEFYHISEASQLIKNANLNGIYEIEADLDFEGSDWPTMFSLNEFKGKMYGKDGNTYELKNISITHSNDSAKLGGVFGKLSSSSTLENLKFTNVTFDLSYVGYRNRETSFGLFAGLIDDTANITNVSVSGSFKIGAITIGDGYQINLVANGNNEKVTVIGTISLTIYGTKQGEGVYNYTVDPDTVKVDSYNDVTFTTVTGQKKESEKYEIQ